MIRSVLQLLILVSLISVSCSRRNNKLDSRNLIPEKKLVSILTDVYLTDGLLEIPKISALFSSLDTLPSYNQIIKNYGYSKEIMDRTLKYYFIKKPKKLVTIYDQVLATLSEMESLIDLKAVLEERRRLNQWSGIEFYSFPDPSATDSSFFDITLSKPNNYSLTFSVTAFPDDQSHNPRFAGYSSHADSSNTGKREYLKPISYIKDGHSHDYTINIYVFPNKPLFIRGLLNDFESRPVEWGSHIIIENISLTAGLAPL